MAQIARVEGMTSLYAGLTPTLLMAVPNTVLYFTCYDELKKRMLKEKLVKTETMAHGLAGAMARTVAVIAVAPVEFVRTRLQAGLGGGVLGTMGAAVREVGGGGSRGEDGGGWWGWGRRSSPQQERHKLSRSLPPDLPTRR